MRFWGECLLCVTHLINRMPLSSVGFHSPYERLKGIKPKLTHLKVFGCLCSISTLKTHRTKFHSIDTFCVFLGYPPDQKAYKVFCLDSGKIIITRDIIFHEHHLPFHYTKNPSSTFPIYLPSNTPFNMESDFNIPEPFHFTHDSPSLSAPSSPSLSSPDTTTSPLVSYPTNTLANLEPSPSFIPRQSSRAKTTPVYLNNYVCLADNVSNHWCNIVQFHHLPPPIQAFINHTTEICEPVNY